MEKHRPQTSPISFMATRKIASSNYKRPLRSPCSDENSNYNHNGALNYVSSTTNFILNDMDEELYSYSEIFNMEVSSYNTVRASASRLSLIEGKPTASSENPPLKEGQYHLKKELESILMRERGRRDELAMHVEEAFNEALNNDNDNDNDNNDNNDSNNDNKKNLMKDVKRWVMRRLRSDHGYNAAICVCINENTKTTNQFLSLLNSFPSSEKHEYIDVILPNKVGVGGVGERVFVEVEFRTQFEIARPSASYKELVSLLPEVYVGNALHLLHLLRLMCDACKSSMEHQGMCLPPWRSFDFIQARWFSPFSRITTFSTSLTHVSPHYKTKHCSNKKEWHPYPPNKLFDSSNSPSSPFSPSSTSCSDSEDDNRERMINVVGALKKALMECHLA